MSKMSFFMMRPGRRIMFCKGTGMIDGRIKAETFFDMAGLRHKVRTQNVLKKKERKNR